MDAERYSMVYNANSTALAILAHLVGVMDSCQMTYSCIFSQLLLENPTIISTVQCSNFQNIGVTGSETFAIFHFR